MLETQSTLRNQSKNLSIVERVWVANTYYSRAKGLLGKTSLPANETLWIHQCNSIHTFFMKFPIDAVFVDKDLKVKSVKKNIKPGRLILPVFGADSVFEFNAGTLNNILIDKGDQFYVGS